MFKAKNCYDADFCRDNDNPFIEVCLKSTGNPVSLNHCNIAYCSEVLSQEEIKTVIEILETKKELMLKECDFPRVYGKMLNDLIAAYKERYGKFIRKDNKNRMGYCLSIWQLEELLKEHFEFKEVNIDSIYAGSNDNNATKIKIGYEGILYISFSGVDENEKNL